MHYQNYLTDCSLPWLINDDPGTPDLVRIDGLQLLKQRLLRLLFTKNGELLHRPSLGADLQRWRNAAPTSINIRRIKNDIDSILKSMDEIDDYTIDVAFKNSTFEISITAEINGEVLIIKGVPIV